MSTIQVKQAALAVSSTYDFGNGIVTVTGSPVVFTILNTGSSTVQIGGSGDVQITGADAADFVLGPPAAAALASGQGTTFSIAFKAASAGSRTAMVTVAPQSGASSVSFSAAGTGFNFGVEQNGQTVSKFNFPTLHGAVPATGTPVTFTIVNKGSTGISSVSVLAGAGFTLGGLSTTSIPAGGTATFDLTFAPASYGTTTSTTTVSATGVPSYVFTASGTCTSGSLALKDASGNLIGSGGTVNIGTVYQGGTTSSFTVLDNSSSDPLYLAGGTPTVTSGSAYFSLTPNFMGSIAAASAGTVTINAGSPSATGTYNATVLVQTSDAGNLSLTFQITMYFINAMHP